LFVACLSVPFLFGERSVYAQTDPDAGAPPPATAGSAVAPQGTPATPPPRGSLMPPASGAAGGGLTISPSMTGAGGTTSTQPMPAGVDPAGDARELAAQGRERPSNDGSVGARPGDVYSEDWWGKTRPILELHGYFRVRGELYHNFFLGRHNAPGIDRQNLWPQPTDNTYTDTSGTPHTVALCGDNSNQPCFDKTQAHANMRFRINPELHISDNLRIVSQIDALDNLVLGSTPDAYAIQPSSKGGYAPAGNGYNGYAPLGGFTTTQGPPTAGVNGTRNSIDVKRAWAEYMTPVGQLRFGRMPSHWGLGMLANSGDHIDADYHTTADRIMFVSGIKALDLYFGGAWDFVSTGNTSQTPYDLAGGQPYNTNNLTNVNQWVLFLARRMNPDLQRLALARGDLVLNGGLYAVYRTQILDVVGGQTAMTGVDPNAPNNGLEHRGAAAFIPDPWVQVLWKKFRFEAEFAAIIGSVDKTPQNAAFAAKIRQYGLTTQTEFKAIEDKLRLQFGFGWASGDPWNESINPGATGLQPELNGGRGPISTFRFNPAYQVDLIFFRKILTRVEGAYYFRPSVEYDFLRSPNGQKFGGGAAIIWSRASEFVQTPGHKRDLGVELDLSLYYQAKDGSLNDDPDKVGGFFAMLQYGVFFPLGGLSYMPGEQDLNKLNNWDTSSAQTIRLFLGVVY
jgi:uncharacterized protein (TIGR04551 family)